MEGKFYLYTTYIAVSPRLHLTKREAVSGKSASVNCFITVSALRNFEIKWFFARSGSQVFKLLQNAATNDNYDLILSNMSEGSGDGEVTANSKQTLPFSRQNLIIDGPITRLNVNGRYKACLHRIILNCYHFPHYSTTPPDKFNRLKIEL